MSSTRSVGSPALGDGAALPMLDPRLFTTLVSEANDRRAGSSESEYIILSANDLAEFDPERVWEVRTALCCMGTTQRWDPAALAKRAYEGPTLAGRLLGRLAVASGYITFAFALGILSGMI